MSVSEPPVPAAGETAPAAEEIRVARPAVVSVLRIVSGLHMGASRPLSAQEMLLIGSSGDCDIVLSDPGVAPRHALLTRMGGSISLRALDAPLQVDGHTLNPGDPAELSAMQRVDLGSASLAVGAAEDPAWAAILPNLGEPQRPQRSFMRHLPLIAGLATLSLVSVAIASAVLPRFEKKASPKELAQPLIREFSIAGGRLVEQEDGSLVLSGTVRDANVREMIRKRLATDQIDARLDLRTGDDIAADVREVLRSQGLSAQTRYLGNGDVEASGHFPDMSKFESAIASRAMLDVNGVRKVLARNLDPSAQPATAASPAAATAAPKPPVSAEPTRIVQIVRGDSPYVVDIDGNQYRDGDTLSDGRRLTAIGDKKAWAQNPVNGEMEELKAQPVTAAEQAAAAAAAAGGVAAAPASGAPPAPGGSAPAPAQGSAPGAAAAPATAGTGAATAAKPAAPASGPATRPSAPAKPATVAEAPARTPERR